MGSDSDLPVMEARFDVLREELAANAQEIYAKDAALQEKLRGLP